MKNTIVTLPTFEEINACPNAGTLTDYAVHMGAVASHLVIEKPHDRDRKQKYYGENWLREIDASFGKQAMLVCHYGLGAPNMACSRFVDDASIGVAPRFVNPKANGFGVTGSDEQQYLTYHHKKVLYPQTKVDDALAQKLNKLQLDVKGSFVAPDNYHQDMHLYNHRLNNCYYYQGKNYVRASDKNHRNPTWFLCEPVAVNVAEDGSIQCQQMLFGCAFDASRQYFDHSIHPDEKHCVDVEHYALGKFMNQAFVKDLQLSVGLKSKFSLKNLLPEIKFNNTALRNLTDDRHL